jgi:hypothetical protein
MGRSTHTNPHPHQMKWKGLVEDGYTLILGENLMNGLLPLCFPSISIQSNPKK